MSVVLPLRNLAFTETERWQGSPGSPTVSEWSTKEQIWSSDTIYNDWHKHLSGKSSFLNTERVWMSADLLIQSLPFIDKKTGSRKWNDHGKKIPFLENIQLKIVNDHLYLSQLLVFCFCFCFLSGKQMNTWRAWT